MNGGEAAFPISPDLLLHGPVYYACTEFQRIRGPLSTGQFLLSTGDIRHEVLKGTNEHNSFFYMGTRFARVTIISTARNLDCTLAFSRDLPGGPDDTNAPIIVMITK
jgi:hypothetical protein